MPKHGVGRLSAEAGGLCPCRRGQQGHAKLWQQHLRHRPPCHASCAPAGGPPCLRLWRAVSIWSSFKDRRTQSVLDASDHLPGSFLLAALGVWPLSRLCWSARQFSIPRRAVARAAACWVSAAADARLHGYVDARTRPSCGLGGVTAGRSPAWASQTRGRVGG